MKIRGGMFSFRKYILPALLGILLVAGSIYTIFPLDADTYIGAQQGIIITDIQGMPIYTSSAWGWYQRFEDIPSNAVQYIVALEDKRFWSHYGVDMRAIARALYENIRGGRVVEGASTLDQQLVKLHQWAYQRSYFQKLKEIFRAVQLNLSLSKQQIFLWYVNHLDFPYWVKWMRGWCQLYFGKSCDSLSTHQLLFVLASSQLWNNPFREADFDVTKQRAIFLCGILYAEDESACSQMMKQSPLKSSELLWKEVSEMPHITSFFLNRSQANSVGTAQHIRTHIDKAVFRRIEQIIQNTFSHRESVDAKDCCVLVMDGRGDLISMNVCRERKDDEAGKLNGCLAKRQTWSAMKPFVYMYAMQKLWLTSADIIVDEPVTYQLDEESLYTPQNFDLSYHGKVTLAQALGNSLNIPAVKLLHDAGAEGFVSFLSEMRTVISNDEKEQIKKDADTFSADRQGLSLALGTYEMSSIEFAKLWKVWFLWDTQMPAPKDAYTFLDTYHIQIDDIANILQNSQNRLISFGQENYLNAPGWIVKTWTSRHFVDGWVCGANVQKDRIICVRMGNYDAKPLRAGSVTTAGYLWRLVVDTLE